MPPLLRGYLRLGAWIGGEPAHDADFDVADFFVLLSLDRVDTRYLRHFLGEPSVGGVRPGVSGYDPTSGCGRGCLPRRGTVPPVAFPLRIARVIALVAVLFGGVGVALSVPLLTAAGRARAVRGWFRAVVAASGIRLVVIGVDHRGAAPTDRILSGGGATLVAANHVSWLDIPTVLAVEPMRVLAKSDVRGWPVIGLLASRGGTLFIDRVRLRRLPGTVAEIADTLRGGESVLAFPEGSTWCGRTQGRFYPATLQSAIDAGVPVRPVSLRYRLGRRFADHRGGVRRRRQHVRLRVAGRLRSGTRCRARGEPAHRDHGTHPPRDGRRGIGLGERTTGTRSAGAAALGTRGARALTSPSPAGRSIGACRSPLPRMTMPIGCSRPPRRRRQRASPDLSSPPGQTSSTCADTRRPR